LSCDEQRAPPCVRPGLAPRPSRASASHAHARAGAAVRDRAPPLDQLDDAEAIYEQLRARWPDHPDVLNHLGLLRHQRGDHDQALVLLRRALEITPDASGVWNNLGNVLLKRERVDEAEQAFRAASNWSTPAGAGPTLSRVLRRRRAWAESEAACRQAIALCARVRRRLAQPVAELARPGPGAGRHPGRRPRSPAAAAATSAAATPYARALVLVGAIDEAAEIFRQGLVEEPGKTSMCSITT